MKQAVRLADLRAEQRLLVLWLLRTRKVAERAAERAPRSGARTPTPKDERVRMTGAWPRERESTPAGDTRHGHPPTRADSRRSTGARSLTS